MSKYKIVVHCDGEIPYGYLNQEVFGKEAFDDDARALSSHMIYGNHYKKPYAVTNVEIMDDEHNMVPMDRNIPGQFRHRENRI
jgi:hypothetical protein